MGCIRIKSFAQSVVNILQIVVLKIFDTVHPVYCPMTQNKVIRGITNLELSVLSLIDHDVAARADILYSFLLAEKI